jgi:hypothetical protein
MVGRHVRRYSLLSFAVLALGGAVHSACTSAGDTAPCANPALTSAKATEWVGFHAEVDVAPDAFHALASGLFAAGAQAGKTLKDQPLTTGVFISSAADPSTPDQTRLTIAFDDGDTPRRTLAVAPASFTVGNVFLATVDAAVAKMQADTKAGQATAGEGFYLEYRVASSQGGKLSFGLKGDVGVYKMVVDVTSPRTSLDTGRIGTAAEEFAATDSVAGTVWFHMTKDDFDFFVDHAYGKGATSKQNFTDFALVPHDWLRLTVEPHLDQKFVSVGFEVITVDNKRVAVAKAPASVLAGSTFQAMVDRNMGNMNAEEAKKPGSSTPWQVPFYYDHPDGGGVVQVIAQGTAGLFSVAYAVESPRHALTDVPFVEYQPVVIPPPDPSTTQSCEKLGDPSIVLAPKGTLDITFSVSDVIKKDAVVPLKGTIYCSVYHAEDVVVTGPKAGAKTVQDFNIPNADFTQPKAPTFTTQELYAGKYQVLCAQDLDKSGDASKGDPVTLPIGSYLVACNKNPTTVEFSLLDPG